MCQLPSPGVQVRASPLWRRTWGTGQQRGQRAWHRPPRPSPETHIAKKKHRLGGCHRCCQVLCWGRGSLCHGSRAHIKLRGPWWSPHGAGQLRPQALASHQCTFRSPVFTHSSARPCFFPLVFYSMAPTERHPPCAVYPRKLLPGPLQKKKKQVFSRVCLKQPGVDNNNNLCSLPSFLRSQ